MWMSIYSTNLHMYSMTRKFLQSLILLAVLAAVSMETIELPLFSQLKQNYPGYKHHGGKYRNHHLIHKIGCDENLLLRDTSALRLSYALNQMESKHSLGRQLIRLSKYGRDSVPGKDGKQYIYHPIAYGPYLADKYGYPNVSKLHQLIPMDTKKQFWGKQGILRVITYTKHSNLPKGHVALWDCNHFHQSKDWIAGHSLITVEFWESPDSNCATKDKLISNSAAEENRNTYVQSKTSAIAREGSLNGHFVLPYFHGKERIRHAKHRHAKHRGLYKIIKSRLQK